VDDSGVDVRRQGLLLGDEVLQRGVAQDEAVRHGCADRE
jgi:hypothetical protein